MTCALPDVVCGRVGNSNGVCIVLLIHMYVLYMSVETPALTLYPG